MPNACPNSLNTNIQRAIHIDVEGVNTLIFTGGDDLAGRRMDNNIVSHHRVVEKLRGKDVALDEVDIWKHLAHTLMLERVSGIDRKLSFPVLLFSFSGNRFSKRTSTARHENIHILQVESHKASSNTHFGLEKEENILDAASLYAVAASSSFGKFPRCLLFPFIFITALHIPFALCQETPL